MTSETISPDPILITLFTLELAPWHPPHPSMPTRPNHLHPAPRMSHFSVFQNSIQSQKHATLLFSLLPNADGLPHPIPSIPQVILKPVLSSPSCWHRGVFILQYLDSCDHRYRMISLHPASFLIHLPRCWQDHSFHALKILQWFSNVFRIKSTLFQVACKGFHIKSTSPIQNNKTGVCCYSFRTQATNTLQLLILDKRYCCQVPALSQKGGIAVPSEIRERPSAATS